MRNIWLGVAAVSFVVMLITNSPGLLALALIAFSVSAFAVVIGLVQSRIEDRSRPEEYFTSATDLVGNRRAPPAPKAAAPRAAEPDDEP